MPHMCMRVTVMRTEGYAQIIAVNHKPNRDKITLSYIEWLRYKYNNAIYERCDAAV